MTPKTQRLLSAAIALLLLTASSSAQPATTASDEREMTTIKLADGALKFTAPQDWEQIKPRNNIIEVELAVTAEDDKASSAADDEPSARLTIMSAGGSVDANLTRWRGQFQKSKKKPEIDKAKVGEMPLTMFDVSGTYLDSPRGPFGPKEEKPGYRMIAGILETKALGNYFFKLVGPAEVVEPNAEAFRAMLQSVELTKATPAAGSQP